MGKSTISMAMFNSFLYVYQRVNPYQWIDDHPDMIMACHGSLRHGVYQCFSGAMVSTRPWPQHLRGRRQGRLAVRAVAMVIPLKMT